MEIHTEAVCKRILNYTVKYLINTSSNLTWKPRIPSIAKHTSQKLGFLSRARSYFSPSLLLTIYKSQIRPSLEYCSHVWGSAPKSALHLLDKVQSKAIRLINNPHLTISLQSLSHRRLVADLSFSTATSRTLLSGNQEYYS